MIIRRLQHHKPKPETLCYSTPQTFTSNEAAMILMASARLKTDFCDMAFFNKDSNHGLVFNGLIGKGLELKPAALEPAT